MSGTSSAACCTPSPRWSSTKRWIWEARKAGRRGSLLANFTPLFGSHITVDLRPVPCWLPFSISSSVWN